MNEQYVKPERLWLKQQPNLTEKWIQGLIAADPSILGLGDLVVRDRERRQPTAGRLDLLLQETDTQKRYEVELQLGSTDEAHIVRTIEYWDIERKRYPQYDHCAVIIAEDITSRFLNVISLFNGTIPLVALQMQALRVGNALTLVFTTVVDELSRGVVDEDEDAEAAPTDRSYWEERASASTIALTDELLNLAREIDPSLALTYNKFYIGMSKDGRPFNFCILRPRRQHIGLNIKLPQSQDVDEKIEASSLDALEYNARRGYRLRLSPEDVRGKQEALKELMKLAYDYRSA